MKPYLSVVIPAYNESINITEGLLTPAFSFLKNQKYIWEVYLIDDGSTDRTFEIARKFCF